LANESAEDNSFDCCATPQKTRFDGLQGGADGGCRLGGINVNLSDLKTSSPGGHGS